MLKPAKKCITRTLVEEYDTRKNDEVREEVEMIASMYDNVIVSRKSTAIFEVRIPLASAERPGRRVTLEIRIVPGYPHVAPAVTLKFPFGVSPGDQGTLSEQEVKHLSTEVLNNIEPCLHSGMPCMMLIASTVAALVESGAEVPEPPKRNGSTHTGPSSTSPGQSPSLTPIPLKAKDALKLSMFAFHLLKKCCNMKDPESNEEANSNFDWLVEYLLSTLSIFPAATRSFFPWSGLPFSKAFESATTALTSLPGERQELAQWLWQDEGRYLRLQQGSEGRYRNEFIQQRLLGAGGFAPVYVCRKKIDGRLYAIKKVAMTEMQSAKVLREVQTLAALNHKHIVRYYDAWVEDGCEEELRAFVGDEEEEEEEGKSDSDEEGCAEGYGHTIVCATSSSDDDSETSSYISSSASNSDAAASDSDEEGASAKTRRAEAHRQSTTHYQTLYIQMELCAARSLRHLIEEGDNDGASGIFTSANGEKVAVSILRQLLTVTAHTHRERIVHRDLKPDNVLFEMESVGGGSEEAGSIRVADFGLARVMSGVKRVTSVADVDVGQLVDEAAAANHPTGNCGSVLYCAPEQERGLEYDFKVDEFSVGMIALEMWLAIAGKGFRDRFTIMNEVWRTGKLPAWFITWNPTMSEIIEQLLQPDPRLRATCEAILNTAELPGDPADLTAALATVDRYGERIAGRLVQRIIRNGSEFRKPSIAVRDDTRFLGSAACTEAVQAAELVSVLHGAAPVALFDHLLPMNPKLLELNVESVVDGLGRSLACSALPHLAAAAFLGMQENGAIGSFYQMYYRTLPYLVFTTPLPRQSVINELTFDPVLWLCHLLSLMETQEPLEVVVSHAHWLQTVTPSEVGTRPPPAALSGLRSAIKTADQIGQGISHINASLASSGLVGSDERDDGLRRYVAMLMEVLALSSTHFGTHVRLVLDPALSPSDALVTQRALDNGLIFQLQTVQGALPLAFGCALENFVARCAVVNADAAAFTVVVHLQQLLKVGKHLQMSSRDALVLDGVAARRHDLYSLANIPYVMEAAMQLWTGNVRVSLRPDVDAHALTRVLKQKQLRWILLDGKRIVSASSAQQGKLNSRHTDIALDDLRGAVRELSARERVTTAATVKVAFLSSKADDRLSDKAVKLLEEMSSVKSSVMLAVNADVDTIQECISQLSELSAESHADAFAVPLLAQWIKTNIGSIAVLPILSQTDGKIVFFINHRRFKLASFGKQDRPRKKK